MAQGNEQRQHQLRATQGERVVAVVLAVYAAIAFIAIGSSVAILGVALAVGLVATAVVGNRAAMALVSFLTVFGPWSAFFVLATPHIAFAAYLVWRAKRLENSV